MRESSIDRVVVPVPQVQDAMTEIRREGARKLLGEMIRQEVEEWLAERAHPRDEQGRRQVVRNGYLPEREIVTGLGPIAVRLRTKRTEGSESRAACLAIVYKRMQSASKKWKVLNGSKILVEVLKGALFLDGIIVPQVAA